MKTVHNTNGYSLVEVMVAIAILLIAIVGPMTIAAKGLQSSIFAREQNTGFFLAQEGLEAIGALRQHHALQSTSTGWANFIIDIDLCTSTQGCGIDFRDETLATNIVGCTAAECVLQYDENGLRAVYRHGGPPANNSPYTRVIFAQHNGSELRATSTVTWNSTLLGGVPHSVELTTSFFELQ